MSARIVARDALFLLWSLRRKRRVRSPLTARLRRLVCASARVGSREQTDASRWSRLPL